MKEKLIEMVKKGIHEKEIMKALGIQTGTSLRRMYYDALVEAGKIKAIMSEREVKRTRGRKVAVGIGKRGTVTLSQKVVVDQLGFKRGDIFPVSKRKDSIVLRKAGPDEDEGNYAGPRVRHRRKRG